MPFCVLAVLWNDTAKPKRCRLLWKHDLGFCNQVFYFFFLSTARSLLTKYVLTNRNGAATLGHWEEVWCRTLKRSKYLLKCLLLACHTLSGGVAQVLWAVSDALNKGWSVWESLRERLLVSFFSVYPGSGPEMVLSVISLPVFSTSIYLVTSALEFTHRASKRRRH